MEKVKEFLKLDQEAEQTVSRLTVQPHRVGYERSFYNEFALRGLRVDRVEPGFVSCTFKVPPRLTDKNGNLATGAIANIVDEVGGAAVFVIGLPMKVSVDMCISLLGTAKLDDELEITSKALGQRGNYAGTINIDGTLSNLNAKTEGSTVNVHALWSGMAWLYNEASPLGWWTLKPRPKEEREQGHLYERREFPCPVDAMEDFVGKGGKA
ncbi:hypothetical protein V6N12_064750 [Hibiscus sabdariffa]|uniref:Uncharacterized protein n=1 Tax=Hibiscus sabdariffa TaxID=183260 RepID=A0ABR2G6N3_9ROSI